MRRLRARGEVESVFASMLVPRGDWLHRESLAKPDATIASLVVVVIGMRLSEGLRRNRTSRGRIKLSVSHRPCKPRVSGSTAHGQRSMGDRRLARHIKG